MSRMEVQVKGYTVKVPAGTYFLGDPCYAVPDDDWMELLHSCAYFGLSEAELGETAKFCGPPSAVGEVRGYQVVAFSTAYGDGEYRDQWGDTYGVDAGLIGLTPVALADEAGAELTGLGAIVTFDRDTTATTDGEGRLTFGPYLIDTAEEEEEAEPC